MKKNVLSVLVSVLSVSALIAQDVKESKVNLGNEFNHWSVDINGGINKPTTPFAQGYFTTTPSLFHADLGARYMFNNKFGIKADFGYDQLKNHDDSLEFDGQYYRTSLQGVVNIGRVLNFEDWTQMLNLQAHGGVGYSFMKNEAFEGTDNMANFILGLTGQIKLTNRVALNGDFSMVNHIRQSRTFDGTQQNPDNRGFDGTLFNASIGLSIYLGKNEKHADWYFEENLSDRVSALETRVGELETMNNDSDKDGVVDYLDQEPNTIAGVAVDSKGRTIDRNNNGVADELESYLNKTYGEGSGATASQNTIEELINGGYVNIYFDTNSTQPNENSVGSINYLVKYLKANPSAKADVIGYADEIGSAEYNNDLSTRRAVSVKNILISSGIDASRMDIKGNGEDASVSKDSKVARSIVRRVTFRIK